MCQAGNIWGDRAGVPTEAPQETVQSAGAPGSRVVPVGVARVECHQLSAVAGTLHARTHTLPQRGFPSRELMASRMQPRPEHTYNRAHDALWQRPLRPTQDAPCATELQSEDVSQSETTSHTAATLTRKHSQLL